MNESIGFIKVQTALTFAPATGKFDIYVCNSSFCTVVKI